MQFDPMLMQSLRGAQFNQPRTPRGPVNDVVPGGPGGFGPPPMQGGMDLISAGQQFAPQPPTPGMNFPGMPGGFAPPPMQTGFGEKPGFNPNMSVREQFQNMGQKPSFQQPTDGEISRRRQYGRALMARKPTPKLPQATQPGAPTGINPLSMY